MCFVLDINSFHCLFDINCREHVNFAPLRDWLYNNPRTSLVIGGTIYRDEIGRLNKYYNYLIELKRARKLSEIDNAAVDAEKDRILSIENSSNFDDAHIVALFCASGCLIFASQDKRADFYLKMKALYPKGHKRPKIYRNKKHRKMLVELYIVPLNNCPTSVL